MSDASFLSIQSVRLPNVSYGPFALLEAVPWLMLATAMRILAVNGGLVALCASVCSDVSIFLAFLLAARRMIELTAGETGLGKLSFGAQLLMARKVLIPIMVMMILTAMVVASAGASWTGMNLLLGFDGIAFDQFTRIGMAWSAFLAAVMLLMVLSAESTGRANLFYALKELAQRATCMVPAIIVLAAADIGLSLLQGRVRVIVSAYWHADAQPQLFKTLIYVLFIFGFASIRLWLTLAILVFALRRSYWRGDALPVPKYDAAQS